MYLKNLNHEKIKGLFMPVLFVVLSVAAFGCDCKDDDELRRLEREKQNQAVNSLAQRDS